MTATVALEQPLHEWELLDDTDALAGVTWTVRPGEHIGHRMTVVGRIVATSMFIVACECGHQFRMAYPTVANKRDAIKEPL